MKKSSKTKRNLWLAFLDEAKANQLYIAYAQKARQEGHEDIARLFEEISLAETSHALSHLKALREVQSTYENLKQVVEFEAKEAQAVFPRLLEEVRREGDPDAILSLETAMREGDKHLELFSSALKNLERELQMPIPSVPAAPAAPSNIPIEPQPEVKTEKPRIAGLERIREIVFGMQDGVISTLAVASSIMTATGRSLPTLLAGLASALAGTISMASGTYLASKSEKELHQAELEKEEQELIHNPEEETAELVQMYRQEGFTYEEAVQLTDRVGEDRDLWLKTLAEKELGLPPEAARQEDPWKDSMTMGISFFFGSLVAILPYFILKGMAAVPVSVAAGMAVLFALGALKTKVTRRSPWTSGLEATAIGALAGLFGYLLGNLLTYILPSVKGFAP